MVEYGNKKIEIDAQVISSELVPDENTGKIARRVHLLAIASKEDYKHLINKTDKDEFVKIKI